VSHDGILLRPAPLRSRASINPLIIVHVVVIAILCVLVLYPALIVVNQAIRDDQGALSLVWFIQAYATPRNYSAILNTLIIAASTSVLAVGLGTTIAWAVSRTNMPGRALVELSSLIPFIAAPLVGALAWILLGSPEVGLINQVWHALGGPGNIVNIYSLAGIVFVEVLYETPMVVLIVASALRSMDSSLEEASLSSGASTAQTTLRITLPLVLPAILASGLLVFILAAEQFAVPAVLGTPSRIRVLTTSIWEAQSVYPPRDGLAGALSVTLLVLALIGLWLYRRILGRRSFTTVRGKSGRTKRLNLGKLRWLLFALCVIYLLCGVVLPVSTIFLSSIRKIWTADFRWEQFTLDNYRVALFGYPMAQRAIVNSLLLAVFGAAATILFCALISFLSLRSRFAGSALMDALTIIPMGFPGIVLAVGLLHAWSTPPFVLYGTIWILFVAYLTRFLPVGVRTISASLTQLHTELEEASLSCGANWLQTFRHIVIPLLRPSLIAGWALLFVAFTRELSASILLYSPKIEVLSVVIYTMYQEGGFRTLCALTMLQIAVAVVILALTKIDLTTEGQAAR
jgi:iron(III) transport system permease protein